MRLRSPRPRQSPPETARFEWPPLRLWLWTVGVIAAIAGLGGVLDLRRPMVSEWRSEVVTVVSHASGHSGKYGASYTHRVRLPDGTHGTITLRELLARDERLRVDYARTDGGLLFRTPIRCRDRPGC